MDYGVLHENPSADCVHNSQQPLRIANLSIYLIDKGCMLHESVNFFSSSQDFGVGGIGGIVEFVVVGGENEF